MGGVPEVGRLSDHLPADLGPLPEQHGEGEPGDQSTGNGQRPNDWPAYTFHMES